MINKFRNEIIFFLIKRELRKNRIINKSVSLQTAKTIGILSFLDSEKKHNEDLELKKNLEKENKHVTALGFIADKNAPDFYLAQSHIDIFTKKNINIFGIPKGIYIRNFIKKDFDFLINVSVNNVIPLQYIAGISKAKIKVGKYRKDMLHIYDFMIKEPEGMQYDDFLKSILKYLSLLNTSIK